MAEVAPPNIGPGFVGPPKKLLKRRYDREKRFRNTSRKRNMFSWEDVDGVRIPYIFRGDRKYVLVSVINEQLLARYPRCYPEEIRNCAPLLSTGITPEEADMLNQMEKQIFGDIGGPFLTGDLIVELDDALNFYRTLRDHYKTSGTIPKPTENAGLCTTETPITPVDVNDVSMTPAYVNVRQNVRSYVPGYSVGYMHVIPDGWILINNAVSPCIRRITSAGQIKLLPLPVVEEGMGKQNASAEIVSSPIECFVLTAMCRAVGHQFVFPVGLKLISLSTVLESDSNLFVYRLSDQDPFECAASIINKHLEADAMAESVMTPMCEPRQTSADQTFVSGDVGKGLHLPTTVDFASETGNVNPVVSPDQPTPHTGGLVPDTRSSADDPAKDNCCDQVLDLSTHRLHREPAAQPQPDGQRRQDDVEKTTTDTKPTAGQLVSAAVEQVVRNMTTLSGSTTSNAFATAPAPADTLQLNSAPLSLPSGPNGVCVKSAASWLHPASPIQSLQEKKASPLYANSTNGNEPASEPAVDLVPEGASTLLEMQASQQPPSWKEPQTSRVQRGRKRKNLDCTGCKPKQKRGSWKRKNDLLSTSSTKQQSEHPMLEESVSRANSTKETPPTLFELSLKRCRAIFKQNVVSDGSPMMKDHLKKWLMMRKKAKQHYNHSKDNKTGNEPSVNYEDGVRRRRKHKSVVLQKHAGTDELKEGACRTQKEPSYRAVVNGSTTGQCSIGKATVTVKATTSDQAASKPNKARRLPTMSEMVDEINSPPVRYKRKCPFSDYDRLPKLPFLGLAGPHPSLELHNSEREATGSESPAPKASQHKLTGVVVSDGDGGDRAAVVAAKSTRKDISDGSAGGQIVVKDRVAVADGQKDLETRKNSSEHQNPERLGPDASVGSRDASLRNDSSSKMDPASGHTTTTLFPVEQGCTPGRSVISQTNPMDGVNVSKTRARDVDEKHDAELATGDANMPVDKTTDASTTVPQSKPVSCISLPVSYGETISKADVPLLSSGAVMVKEALRDRTALEEAAALPPQKPADGLSLPQDNKDSATSTESSAMVAPLSRPVSDVTESQSDQSILSVSKQNTAPSYNNTTTSGLRLMPGSGYSASSDIQMVSGDQSTTDGTARQACHPGITPPACTSTATPIRPCGDEMVPIRKGVDYGENKVGSPGASSQVAGSPRATEAASDATSSGLPSVAKNAVSEDRKERASGSADYSGVDGAVAIASVKHGPNTAKESPLELCCREPVRGLNGLHLVNGKADLSNDEISAN